MNTIGIIGGGNMGAALIKGLKKDYRILVCESDAGRRSWLKKNFKMALCDLADLARASDILVLAVKPQQIDDVLKDLSAEVKRNQMIISIAAGITVPFLEKRLPARTRVIRAMPNLPALVGAGTTAVCRGHQSTTQDLKEAVRIFSHIGTVVTVKEALIDAVTAVSGSGPAYVFLFVECLQQAAQALGLPKDLAARLISGTLSGSMRMIGAGQDSPAELRARVTSKGGTTQAAMDVFTGEDLAGIYRRALAAAKRRAKELAKR